MHRSESSQRSRFRHDGPPAGVDPALSILIFLASLAAASSIALFLWLPAQLVLPAFGLCAIMAAAGMGLCAGVSPSVATRDLAGAFAVVGCAATILGEVEPLLEFIGQATSRNKADD